MIFKRAASFVRLESQLSRSAKRLYSFGAARQFLRGLKRSFGSLPFFLDALLFLLGAHVPAIVAVT
jgi:hypothetical protein